MAKTFYTEHDIEDMVKRGTHVLTLTDDTVLTDLAFEMASKLGMKIIRPNEKPPSAPTRPYLSQAPKAASSQPAPADIRQRVRDAVIARLGGDVDPKLLDTIIQRVLDNVGIH